MTKESFYDALNSNKYDKSAFERLSFKTEESGPRYQVTFPQDCSDIKKSVEKNNFTLKIITPAESIVKDEKAKKSIISRLIHNGRKF